MTESPEPRATRPPADLLARLRAHSAATAGGDPGAEAPRELAEAAASHIESLERRLAARERLSLAAIFLADTFESDDPDGELAAMRDEWLANRQASSRRRLDAVLRLLVADGHATPVAVRQVEKVLDAEHIVDVERQS